MFEKQKRKEERKKGKWKEEREKKAKSKNKNTGTNYPQSLGKSKRVFGILSLQMGGLGSMFEETGRPDLHPFL